MHKRSLNSQLLQFSINFMIFLQILDYYIVHVHNTIQWKLTQSLVRPTNPYFWERDDVFGEICKLKREFYP